jgi:hypothetical protein
VNACMILLAMHVFNKALFTKTGFGQSSMPSRDCVAFKKKKNEKNYCWLKQTVGALR